MALLLSQSKGMDPVRTVTDILAQAAENASNDSSLLALGKLATRKLGDQVWAANTPASTACAQQFARVDPAENAQQRIYTPA